MISVEQIIEIVVVIAAIRFSRHLFNKFSKKKTEDEE